MYTKISAQFDCIEFAETAAKMIKENIGGQKKITIRRKKDPISGTATSRNELAAANGSTQILYPFSTHSNNYVTNFVIKDIVKDEVNELLQSDSVTMDVVCEETLAANAQQYIHSCGGYSMKS